MYNKLTNLLQINIKKNNEPRPDLAFCENCGWKGKISDCKTDTDGDWEGGYYTIHICPICDEGGDINYEMSEDRANEWNKWYHKFCKKGDKKS